MKIYIEDAQCKLMIDMISNPALIKKANLQHIYYVYHYPMHEEHIKFINKTLYLR